MAIASLVVFNANTNAYPGPNEVVYSSLPSPQPSNVASLGYQATSTTEVGDRLTFAGSQRYLSSVTVGLSSWACETGTWNSGCDTTPGSTFTHPITLNLYEAGTGATPGTLLSSYTQTFEIPFRPSPDPTCTPITSWRDASGICNSGIYNEVTFSIPGFEVPDSIVYGISFNTQSYGSPALGVDGPYNSLNVALSDSAVYPSVGTDADSDSFFWETTYPGYDGTFKEDAGWTPYQVAVSFSAYENIQDPLEINVYTNGDADWSFNPDPRYATDYAFTTAQETLGSGSLYAGPITNSNYNGVATNANWDKFIALQPVEELASYVDSISYDFLIGPGGDSNDDAQFYLNVYTNLPGSTTFYDCRFDYVPTVGSTAVFTTFENTSDTIASATGGSGCGGANSWGEMPAGSTVSSFSLNMGDTSANDQGLDGFFDRVVLGTTDELITYDFEADTVKPTANFVTPNGEAFKNSVPVEFEIEDIQTGLKSAVVNVYTSGNTLIETCGSNSSLGGATSYTINCTVDTSSYSEGTYTLKGGGFDVAGNNRTISTTFVVDKTRPTANFVTPNGEAYKNSVPVEFEISDVNGLNNVVVNIYDDSNTLLGTCGSANAGGATSYTINCTVDTSSYSEGTYTLKGGGFDVAGNNRTISTTFVVDKTPPDVNFLGLTTEDTTPILTGDSDDATVVEVEVDGFPYIASVSGGVWTVEVALPLSIGSYDVEVIAEDSVGNSSNENFPLSLVITQTPPPTTPPSGGDDLDEDEEADDEDNTGEVAGANTGDGDNENTDQTGGIGGEPFVAQASNTDQADANDEDGADEEDTSSPQVLQSSSDGESSDNSEEATSEEGCFEIFGVCWYWFIIPGAIAVVGYLYYRSRQEAEKE
jgi:hypothetical protein